MPDLGTIERSPAGFVDITSIATHAVRICGCCVSQDWCRIPAQQSVKSHDMRQIRCVLDGVPDSRCHAVIRLSFSLRQLSSPCPSVRRALLDTVLCTCGPDREFDVVAAASHRGHRVVHHIDITSPCDTESAFWKTELWDPGLLILTRVGGECQKHQMVGHENSTSLRQPVTWPCQVSDTTITHIIKSAELVCRFDDQGHNRNRHRGLTFCPGFQDGTCAGKPGVRTSV